MSVAGDQTQGLAPASQVLYHWVTSLAHSILQNYFSQLFSSVFIRAYEETII